jgi:hypothetical protein
MAKQRKLVDNRQIVNIEQLGGAYTAKLRGSTWNVKKVQLAPGIFFTTNDTGSEADGDLGPNAMREGFDVYIRLHHESTLPAIRALASDRASFNEQLWQLPIGTFKEKAQYLKTFMGLYYKQDLWLPLLRSDVVLIKILATDAYPSTKPAKPDNDRRDRPRDRKDDTKADRRPDRDRDRGRNNRDRFDRDGHGRGKDDHTTDAKFCETRKDPKAGRCLRGRHCPFDHHCASCLEFHAAVNCPKWDNAKAAANIRMKQ